MSNSIALVGMTNPPMAEEGLSPVYRLREDLDFYEGPFSRNGEPTWTIHDPVRNKFFSIGWLEFELLKHWVLRHPLLIANRTNSQTPLDAQVADIEALDAFLLRNELVCAEDNESSDALLQRFLRKKRGGIWSFVLHRYLFFRIPLVHPDRFLDATLPIVKPVFSRLFAWILVFAAVLGIYLVIRDWNTFTQTFQYLFSLEGILYFALALIVSKCLHEMGHAYTCKRYGLKVPTMGVAFLVLWPFLYTDTTESWKLASRRKRMAIGVAGIAAELGFAVFATLLWSFLPEGALRGAVFFVATASWVITLAININPFMRWDGYYLLSDLLGVQNLQTRSFALGKWRLREFLFGLGEPPPETLSPRLRRLLVIYAYGTWLYRFVLFLGIAVLVYYMFFKALGIVLMLIELAWFIGRPIYAEMSAWYDRRTVLEWNRNTVVSAILLALVAAVLIVPWQRSVTAPAVLQPRLHKTFYSPTAARLDKIYVKPGEIVAIGQQLFDLQSSELEFELRRAGNQIKLLRVSLARLGRSDLLESRDMVQQKLQEAMTAYRGYLSQKSQLEILAPFGGEMVTVLDNLTPGLWISNKLPLATLVDKSTISGYAYVTELQLARIEKAATAWFYPENPALSAVRMRVTEIDRASSTSLHEQPVLASTLGGPIPTRETDDGALVPEHALYRIRLSTGPLPVDLQSTLLRGTVHIEAQSTSWAQGIWRQVTVLLVRESGF
jgi:putative peptide zinc metalloprotease protein